LNDKLLAHAGIDGESSVGGEFFRLRHLVGGAVTPKSLLKMSVIFLMR
jgi:hypothetical protein